MADFCFVCRSCQRRTADELNSELLWLSALHRDGGLVAPEPRPTRTGALFAGVSADGVPLPRHCVLLHWVEGRNRAASLTPEDARVMGVYMARLHRFARSWSVPEGFVRPRLNPGRWIGAAPSLWSQSEQGFS